VFPPCFNESELAKVREWEKTWVGKKVNAANVDQVKDFLPDILVTMMKEPEKWGAKELWFEVVPYQFVPQSKTVAEATKKYSPQSKFSPNGFKTPAGDVAPNEFLEGYEKGEQGAGFPFPKAKTGLEVQEYSRAERERQDRGRAEGISTSVGNDVFRENGHASYPDDSTE
jgi:hypothetical protein